MPNIVPSSPQISLCYTFSVKNLIEFIRGEAAESKEVKGLHPDFKVLYDGFWYFNKIKRPTLITHKVRFTFDSPEALDNCPFYTKVGLNLDESIPNKYVGFAYVNEKQFEELKNYSKKFPYAETIDNLDRFNGESTDRSIPTRL